MRRLNADGWRAVGMLVLVASGLLGRAILRPSRSYACAPRVFAVAPIPFAATSTTVFPSSPILLDATYSIVTGGDDPGGCGESEPGCALDELALEVSTSTDTLLELQVADVVLFLARDREASVFRTNSTELGLPPPFEARLRFFRADGIASEPRTVRVAP